MNEPSKIIANDDTLVAMQLLKDRKERLEKVEEVMKLDEKATGLLTKVVEQSHEMLHEVELLAFKIERRTKLKENLTNDLNNKSMEELADELQYLRKEYT